MEHLTYTCIGAVIYKGLVPETMPATFVWAIAVWAALVSAARSTQNVERAQVFLECHDADENVHKYWSAVVVGHRLFITHGRLDGYGRKGTHRRELPIDFSDNASAMKDFGKRMRAKLRKGYRRPQKEGSP